MSGKDQIQERVDMDNGDIFTEETSYSSLSEEIRRHAHLIEPRKPQFETEYEASYVNTPMSGKDHGKIQIQERVDVDNSNILTEETSYTSLSEEIRRHAHLIEPREPQFETEYEASYVNTPVHSKFLLQSLSPRRHAQRVEELWNNLNRSAAELLNHTESLMPILRLTAQEIKSIILIACEEIRSKDIHGPNLWKLYRLFLGYKSKSSDEDEELKHNSELCTNIDDVLVNNEVLNFVAQYQKLIAE